MFRKQAHSYLWPPIFQSLAIILLLILSACTYRSAPEYASVDVTDPPLSLSEELENKVKYLAETVGERNAYHPAKLESAAEWIEEQFRGFGYTEIRRLPIEVSASMYKLPADLRLWNIEAVLPGTSQKDEQLIIGAHYDTRVTMPGWHAHQPALPQLLGTPGANDNASGVAALLALARMLREEHFSRTVRFVALVNEEPPFFQTEAMGSRSYAAMLRANGFEKVKMISLETIGCYSPRVKDKRPFVASLAGLPNRPDYIAFLTTSRYQSWTKHSAALFSRHSRIKVKPLSFPYFSKAVSWSDDWSFTKAGYPAFTVTDTAFLRSDDYHELSDTPEKLDYKPMAHVVWGLRFLIPLLAEEPEA